MLMVADHPGYEVPREKSWKQFIENMKELGIYAKEHGVILVVESLTPMESPIVTTSDDCAAVIRETGLPNIEAMMDVVPPHTRMNRIVLILISWGTKKLYSYL